MKKNSNKLCKHQNNSKQSILVILSQERCYTLLFFFRVEIILIHLISVTKVKQSNFWQNQWPEIYLTPKAKKHIFFLAKKKSIIFATNNCVIPPDIWKRHRWRTSITDLVFQSLAINYWLLIFFYRID